MIISLSLSDSGIVTPPIFFAPDGDEEAGVGLGGGVGIDVCVLPLSLIFFIDLITFSSVSITSPFLSVILPPSTLYFDKN